MRIGTRQFHPPWYTLEGVALVCAVNVLVFALAVPSLITATLHVLGLEKTLLAGAALVAPFAVIQALAQLATFLPLARMARHRAKFHFAKAVERTSEALAFAMIALIGLAAWTAMSW
jgi:hypothetical protein